MDINANTIKSYATEANLAKALEKMQLAHHPHLTVRNAEGRWTAIFPFSNYQREWLWGGARMCMISFYAEQGFMTLG